MLGFFLINFILLQIPDQLELQFCEFLHAFILKCTHRYHRQPAVKLGRGHGISGFGPAKHLFEFGMSLTFLRHDKPRSHLDTGRPHHQQMGHHSTAGNAAGHKNRHTFHFKQNLLDQYREAYRRATRKEELLKEIEEDLQREENAGETK